MFDLSPESLYTYAKAALFIVACWSLAINLLWLGIKVVKLHAYMSLRVDYDGNAGFNLHMIAASFTYMMVYLFIW